ncbi:glycosyltransferase family 2 protein [Salicibibacter halophilus]|uniref:Glycosyltransferase family 2 protein n=1 Tax=Salicibibacter halophilus TaxID=2502791 RepID=A0A514LLX5_9BACI|nr:glycosyltransferase family A protein [Salicibibacter halophilus]QDI92867.1 glycosyltransferase family 2 protein [Salicibibacter halophilus]
MRNITVLLLDYPDNQTLQAALHSLKNIRHRVKSVGIVHRPNVNVPPLKGFEKRIWTTVIPGHDSGMALNEVLKEIQSTYVLFLKDREYLAPSLDPSTLFLTHEQSVLTHVQSVRNIQFREPFLVKTETLKKNLFYTSAQLPFKEALLPYWLYAIDEKHVVPNDATFVQTLRTSNSKDQLEKGLFLQKLDNHVPVQQSPSLSVLISCFNMDAYVGKAIASCFFQHTQPDQLLIIDDGSEDQSLAEIEKWRGISRVEIICKKNEGKAKALNDALPHVKTDFVVELDADDWLDPDALSTIKQKLQPLPKNISLLYGNFRKWKQRNRGDILFKSIAKGRPVRTRQQLLAYHFPLGPRIYRTEDLKAAGGFPVVSFAEGRLYEDVSVLLQLIKHKRFFYQDFTVYNMREHEKSITKQHQQKWHTFKEKLKRSL